MNTKQFYSSLISLLILALLPCIVHGQEQQDTLKLQLKPELNKQQDPIETPPLIHLFDVPSFEDRMSSYIFNPQLSYEFPTYYQQLIWEYEPVGHRFSNSTFSFISQNQNTTLGFSIQFQQRMGWEKLNLYAFGTGMFFYDGSLTNNLLLPDTQRAVGSTIGFGVEYEIKTGVKIFFEQKQHLKNLTPLGKTQTGGVRLEF